MQQRSAPGLEVGFEINAASSSATLGELMSAIGSAEASAPADTKRIEQATGNMVNLSGVSVVGQFENGAAILAAIVR